jgi:hypothetical protein
MQTKPRRPYQFTFQVNIHGQKIQSQELYPCKQRSQELSYIKFKFRKTMSQDDAVLVRASTNSEAVYLSYYSLHAHNPESEYDEPSPSIMLIKMAY